jgi:hypothetical protein
MRGKQRHALTAQPSTTTSRAMGFQNTYHNLTKQQKLFDLGNYGPLQTLLSKYSSMFLPAMLHEPARTKMILVNLGQGRMGGNLHDPTLFGIHRWMHAAAATVMWPI